MSIKDRDSSENQIVYNLSKSFLAVIADSVFKGEKDAVKEKKGRKKIRYVKMRLKICERSAKNK